MEEKLKKILLLMLIVATVLEQSILIGITVYWRMSRVPQQIQSRLCVSATSLGFGDDYVISPKFSSFDVDDLYQFEKQDNMYCGNVSSILDMLLNKTVMKRYNSDMNPEHSPLTIDGCTKLDYYPSILKLERIDPQSKSVNGNSTKVYWNSDKNSDKASNVEYSKKEGLVYVKNPGKYFISFQLSTKVNNKAVNVDDSSSPKHFVYLISRKNNTEQVLLEYVGSNCALPVDQSEHTSHMAAVFKLQEGDRIYVATSHPHDLLTGHSVNHIIIQKI